MKRLLFVAALTVFFPHSANAKLPPVKLEELVRFSDFIFVGRIHSRGEEALLRGSFNTWGLLQIEVERTICGQFFKEEWPEGRVEVLYPLSPVERPSFDPGNRYLFFWREGYSGPQLAPSFYGAIKVDDEIVRMEPVGDIGRPLPLGELKRMIDCKAATGGGNMFQTPGSN